MSNPRDSSDSRRRGRDGQHDSYDSYDSYRSSSTSRRSKNPEYPEDREAYQEDQGFDEPGEGGSDEHHEHRHHHRHHRHHDHSRRKKKPLWRRIRHWFREHKTLVGIAVALVVLVSIVACILLLRRVKIQESQHVVSGNSYDMGAGYRVLVYDGKRYNYNQTITTLLYGGLDSSGELITLPRYGSAPLVDSISLFVLDKKHKKLSILSISRATITKIRRFSVYGDIVDYYDDFICRSYSYGNGGQPSVDSFVEAVEDLIGVPIDDYVVTNLGALSYINDLVGGSVEVTVPNNDLAKVLAGFTAGNTVKITNENFERFVRYRDLTVPMSNEGRMERQKAYIQAYLEKAKGMIPDQADTIWDGLMRMENFMQSSVTRNKYLSYVNLFNQMDFSATEFFNTPGQGVEGFFHYEYYVDRDALQKLVLDLFYEPA